MKNNKLTIGILAHVDAGKTTLSEGILYYSGITRNLGRVDTGDAFLDTHPLERERGITIFAKQAVFPLGDKEITLVDTPGHADFSAETERTLQILDYVIFVVSGPDGLQGQGRILWRLLEQYAIPTFIFINKIDQPNFDRERVITELQNAFSERCVVFAPEEEGFMEKAALCDEKALEAYLQTGSLSTEMLAAMIQERSIFPCFYGSALKMQGVREFLDAFSVYTRCGDAKAEFSARVYKISRDDKAERLTHMKITGGRLRVKDEILGEKVNQIRIYNGEKFKTVSEAGFGTVCAVTGLSGTKSGRGLGAEASLEKPFLDTALSYSVILPPDWDAFDAFTKLSALAEEIPELHLVKNQEDGGMQLMLMGEIQGEILRELVRTRFDKEIRLGEEKVLYKETILDKVEGVGHFEPLRHYAEVHLILAPLPQGSGMVFESNLSEDALDRNWQNLILTHLQEKPFVGVLCGGQVTDIKISLAAGKAHVKHTEGGDFRQATYRAVRQGLAKAQSRLLEPYYEYRLELPTDFVGKAMADIQHMKGDCNPPISVGNDSVLSGSCPVSTMKNYQKEVSAYTKGLGRLFCTLKGYFPCHNEEEVLASSDYDFRRDVENPADSVFCQRGGSLTVPWNQVEAYMDIPLQLTEKREDEPQWPAGTSRGTYSEEELEAIFRATYGLGKREKNRFNRPSRTVRPADTASYLSRSKSPLNNSSAEPLLLVDGYNMIFAWEELQEMAEVSLAGARSLLVEILQNYQGYTGEKILVVFDAYKQPGNVGTREDYGDLEVIYTREGQTADQFIEKFVWEQVKHFRITVATSDGLEQRMVFSQGALRMSARELRLRVLDINREIREKHLGK